LCGQGLEGTELLLAARKPVVAGLFPDQQWTSFAVRPMTAVANSVKANLRTEIPLSQASIDIAIEGRSC